MTTWNAMTVAGIVLITAGLAILVVFRRQLWGSGGRRPGERRTSTSTSTSGPAGRGALPGPARRNATGAAGGALIRPASYGLASIGFADEDDADADDADVDGADADDADTDETVAEDAQATRELTAHEWAQLAQLAAHDRTAHEQYDGTEPDETDAEHVVFLAAPSGAEQTGKPSGPGSSGARSPGSEPAAAEPAEGPGRGRPGLTHPGGPGARPAPPAAGAHGPGSAAAARATGHRHGDRVDGWVRPDYREPALPVATGEYWLPVADPYADAGYGSPASTDAVGGPDRASSSWSGPVSRYERERRQQQGSDRQPASFASYEVAPAVEPMPAPSFDAAAAFTAARVPAAYGEPTSTPAWPPTRSAHPAPVPPPGGPSQARPELDTAPQHTGARLRTGEQPATAATEGTSADGDADRTGQHFPRRRRAAAARRAPARTDAAPPADQPIRTRVTAQRGETRRRIAVATEYIPTTSETTQLLPTIPVIEGYGGSDPGRPDPARARDPEVTGRPRPRPRPRPGGSAQGEDRQPARSTVYVSRHAAEPN